MNTAIFLHNSRNAFPIVAPGFIISHVTLFNIDTMKIDIIKICVPFIFGSFLVSNFFFSVQSYLYRYFRVSLILRVGLFWNVLIKISSWRSLSNQLILFFSTDIGKQTSRSRRDHSFIYI